MGMTMSNLSTQTGGRDKLPQTLLKCIDCKKWKHRSEYWDLNGRSGRKQPYCIECGKVRMEHVRAGRKVDPSPQRGDGIPTKENPLLLSFWQKDQYVAGTRFQICQRCFHEKPIEDFRISRSKPDGKGYHRSWCKTCDNARINEIKHRKRAETRPKEIETGTVVSVDPRPDIKVTEKVCSICKKTLPSTSFHRDKKSSTGLFSYCKECNNRVSRSRRAAKKSEPTPTPPKESRCSRCLSTKPATEFSSNRTRSGLQSWCKSCTSEYGKERRRKVSELMKASEPELVGGTQVPTIASVTRKATKRTAKAEPERGDLGEMIEDPHLATPDASPSIGGSGTPKRVGWFGRMILNLAKRIEGG
jgi:hypothetical protein